MLACLIDSYDVTGKSISNHFGCVHDSLLIVFFFFITCDWLLNAIIVSRLICDSESFKMELILDINSQLYPVDGGDKFRLMLASTLREDGVADDGEYNPLGINGPNKADNFEYVMYGKIYRLEGDEDSARM